MSFLYDDKLADRERKIISIIQANNRMRHRSPSLRELEIRSGYNAAEIKALIDDLIKRNWIEENNGEWIVTRKLF